jgi:hypothetical protein
LVAYPVERDKNPVYLPIYLENEEELDEHQQQRHAIHVERHRVPHALVHVINVVR